MSILMLVSFAASLAFCPDFPIANDSWLGWTTTLAVTWSSKISTVFTCAGDKLAFTNSALSATHSIISIFSPFNSSTIVLILWPFCPIQAPTVSSPSWVE